MKAVKSKAYKLFANNDVIANDKAIDEFLNEGRELIERREYGSFNMVPVKLPSGILQAGQQQLELQMMFFTLVVFVPTAKEIADSKQIENSKNNLSVN